MYYKQDPAKYYRSFFDRYEPTLGITDIIIRIGCTLDEDQPILRFSINASTFHSEYNLVDYLNSVISHVPELSAPDHHYKAFHKMEKLLRVNLAKVHARKILAMRDATNGILNMEALSACIQLTRSIHNPKRDRYTGRPVSSHV